MKAKLPSRGGRPIEPPSFPVFMSARALAARHGMSLSALPCPAALFEREMPLKGNMCRHFKQEQHSHAPRGAYRVRLPSAAHTRHTGCCFYWFARL